MDQGDVHLASETVSSGFKTTVKCIVNTSQLKDVDSLTTSMVFVTAVEMDGGLMKRTMSVLNVHLRVVPDVLSLNMDHSLSVRDAKTDGLCTSHTSLPTNTLDKYVLHMIDVN